MLLYQLGNIFLESPLYFFITLVLLVVPLLLSITVHEWAHGFTAYKFGDITPKEQGRLSFNPFAHLDPLGTLMIFIAGIGWAKPVQINPNNINNNFKLMLVSLAGPLSNFVLATLFAVIAYFVEGMIDSQSFNIEQGLLSLILILINIIIKINIVLGLFNLIPLPPLDGSNILSYLLPDRLANSYLRLTPYGFPILLVLFFTGMIDYVFSFAGIIKDYLIIYINTFLSFLF